MTLLYVVIGAALGMVVANWLEGRRIKRLQAEWERREQPTLMHDVWSKEVYRRDVL